MLPWLTRTEYELGSDRPMAVAAVQQLPQLVSFYPLIYMLHPYLLCKTFLVHSILHTHCVPSFFIAGTKAFHPGGETPSTSSMARMTSATSMVHIEFRIALHQHRQRDAMRGAGNINATLLPLGVFS